MFEVIIEAVVNFECRTSGSAFDTKEAAWAHVRKAHERAMANPQVKRADVFVFDMSQPDPNGFYTGKPIWQNALK